jgi:protein gp37
MRQAHRFNVPGGPYDGLTEVGPQGPCWTGQIRLVPELLEAPLRWKKPRRIFVNSMSDLFHEAVPAQFIVRAFEVMAACPQHTFQILTKRPERVESVLYGQEGNWYLGGGDWLPNVWLGFSAEDQATFDRRVQVFAPRPGERCSWAYALHLWASLEPLLGPIQLREVSPLRWVVIGGESGHGARPCNVAWIRSIVHQCRAMEVPIFTKQTGSHIACPHDRKGGCWNCMPSDIKFREFPHVA